MGDGGVEDDGEKALIIELCNKSNNYSGVT
jgi:hypothetical protein